MNTSPVLYILWNNRGQLKLEFAGALYHLTSRGDRQDDIDT
ncbi:MAG: hypothetical protein ACI9PZ_000328, partial [Parvicella sp.]